MWLPSLDIPSDGPSHFHAELYQGKQPIERIPAGGTIQGVVPSPDFELIMWQA